MLITIGSITTATRAAKMIRQNLGIAADVVSTPTELNRGGCSYSVRFNDKYESGVRRIAGERKIPVRRWYKESQGSFGHIYNDIS